MFTRVLLVSLALLGAVPAAFAAEPPPQPEARPGGTPQYLDQGWTEAVRDAYYFTAQGSEILPYDWFIAIEQPYNDKLFCEPDHLAHFNFLPYPKSKANPDGLPIGFVKGKGSQGIEWFGLSCAACPRHLPATPPAGKPWPAHRSATPWPAPAHGGTVR